MDRRTGTSSPPEAVVRVRAGPFLYGPRREIRRLDEFEIDRAPVTNLEFARFARAIGAALPEAFRNPGFLERKGDHPVVGVTLRQALAFAQWAGKDLPTAEEWERAARGTDGRLYPWGDRFEPGRCNVSGDGPRDTTPVDRYSSGASPGGCLDLAGNVWEWTRTPLGGGLFAVKGGSWYDPPGLARSDRMLSARATFASSTLGFRCVRRSRPLPPLAVPALKRRTPALVAPGPSGEWNGLLESVRSRAAQGETPERLDPRTVFGADGAARVREALARALVPRPEPAGPASSPLPTEPAETPPSRRERRPPRWLRWGLLLAGIGAALGFLVSRVVLS